MSIGLTEETELALHMWKELAPEVEGKFVVSAADDGDEMIFPGLYGFLGNVSPVIVGRDKLIRHARFGDCCFVGGEDFVVDLLSWGDPACFHA